MHERDLWWKIVIVGSLVAMAFATLWPPREKIKYGIDLYGGYSLLYEIDDTGLSGTDRLKLSENVMTVLRGRVDPKGVYNLVWRPVGYNRLEIQMPRPNEKVRAARQESETLQEKLRDTVLRRSDILRAVAKTGEDRQRSLDGLVQGIEQRKPLLTAVAEAYDTHARMKAEYEQRVQQIAVDNLSDADVRAAVQKPAAERPVAFVALVRGTPERQQLLESAATAWDEYQVALAGNQPAPTDTQPAASQPAPVGNLVVEAKNRAYEAAVARVLAANVDPNKLTEGATLNQVVALDEALDQKVADLLATNIDLGRLQAALDAKPGEAFRGQELQNLEQTYPGLARVFQGLAEASLVLQDTRSSEGGRLEDPADLQRLLKGAGVLEFRILPETSGDPSQFDKPREELAKRGPRPKQGETEYQWFEIEDPAYFFKMKKEDLNSKFEQMKKNQSVVVERFGDKFYVLSHIGENTVLTHRTGEDWSLKGARFTRDQNGRPAIGFSLDERGGSKFGTLTRLNKGRLLAIFLDDQCVSFAIIRSMIRTDGIIEGQFTPQEVNEMVKKLNAGSLPRKLKDPPISVRSIGPSLGEANRTAGLVSAKYGAICVVVFILGYYFYAGGVAIIAVTINTLFTVAIMAAMGATLTLPGIAGLVLAVAMGVDANVLINERIREELARGTAMRMAIRLGYERAFSAILDSNVTTVITCVILYMLGSEEIKGFGLTLGVGVFINIFTAYFVTRMFFELMSMIAVPGEVVKKPIFAALIITAFGGALYGLGYVWNVEALRDRSVMMQFGKAIMYFGPGILGLCLLMWIGRWIHAAFQKGGRPRVPMLSMIGVPVVNWIGLRRVFLGGSLALVVIGVGLFANMDRRELYDIEFLGGTAAQIDLRKDSAIAQLGETTKEQTAVLDRLEKAAGRLREYGRGMANATVSSNEPDQFVLRTPGVPASRLEPVIRAVMEGKLSQEVRSAIVYDVPSAEMVTIRTKTDAKLDLAQMRAKIGELKSRFEDAADAIASAQVQAVQLVGAGKEQGSSFEIVTRETAKEIVVGAVDDGLGDEINIQRALSFNLVPNAGNLKKQFFEVRGDDPRSLGFPISEADAREVDLQDWKGSVAIVLDQINPPQSLEVLASRLRAMRLQPGFENYGWRESKVFGLHSQDSQPSQKPSDDGLFSRALVVVADENYPLSDEEGAVDLWERNLAEKEVTLIQTALQRRTSLSQVTQFDKQVSGEAQIDAYIALVLGWLSIILYLWFRFGNARWGFTAVIALVHDICICMGCIAITHYLADTAIGKFLLLDKFRVDLTVVAALLTVVGYSVNDTIVVFDRIRENRGRLTEVTAAMINNSISQTLARTLLTGLTSLATILIMYIFGGPGIHGFSYVLFIGIVTGTYSSFGIASQLLLRRRVAAAAA